MRVAQRLGIGLAIGALVSAAAHSQTTGNPVSISRWMPAGVTSPISAASIASRPPGCSG